MNEKEPIRLLILEESQNRAEELIVMLRTAGHATRAHQIESDGDFSLKISEQKWDLVLAASEAKGFTAASLISTIQTLDKDIPVIMLADNRDPASITEGLKLGAADVALDDDDERLLLLIERELGHLQNRRQRRKAEVELRETDRRNNLLLDSSTTAIAYVHEGMHIYTNAAYVDLFGYEDEDEYAGIPIIDLIGAEDQRKFKDFLKNLREDESGSDEFSCVNAEGTTLLTTLTMSPATYDGEPCTQAIFKPLIGEAELEDRIKEISSQDLLTGLFNRQYFIEQLESVVDNATQRKQTATIMYIVIDHFPRIRSEAGLSNADLVLGDLATVIRGKVPDDHMVARFGDDVFAILMEGNDKAVAEELAETIRTTVESHMSDASGKNYQVTVSIGLSVVAENTSTVEEAISRAHQAADSIEEGNAIAFYEPAKITVGEEGKSVSADALKDLIAHSLEENLFQLQFQPIVSLHGDDEEQFEVLLRLPDAEGNFLKPGQFLGPAEDAGLLHKMDRWVILQSVKALSEKRATASKTKLFINITHKSLGDEEFHSWMSVALKAAGLPSDAIIFQIHENDATSYIKQAAAFSEGLQALHIKCSINHFGCSLNPFNLLNHLTPDFVKLDGSFATQIENSDERREEMTEMVESLQSKGVLTGICGLEDPSVLPALFMTGINYIQGNYISEPLDDMDYDFSSEDL
ncbi:MAG: EAL domain-containing protein [Pseudomonadales bacterium]|nr:EAL domain-containing protein [Pseudomonadales bacterium]